MPPNDNLNGNQPAASMLPPTTDKPAYLHRSLSAEEMASLPPHVKQLQRRHRWYDHVIELQRSGAFRLDARQRYVQWTTRWFAEQARWTSVDSELFFPIATDSCPADHRVLIDAHLLFIQRIKDEIWHRTQYISNSLSDAEISPFECVAVDECQRALTELETLVAQFWFTIITCRELFTPAVAHMAKYENGIPLAAGTDWIEYLIRAENNLKTGVRLCVFHFSWAMKVALIAKSVLPATMIVLIVALLNIWSEFSRTPSEYADESIVPKIVNNAIVIGGLVVLLFATAIPAAYYDVLKKERQYNLLLADLYKLQAMMINIACRSQMISVYELQRETVKRAQSLGEVAIDVGPAGDST